MTCRQATSGGSPEGVRRRRVAAPSATGQREGHHHRDVLPHLRRVTLPTVRNGHRVDRVGQGQEVADRAQHGGTCPGDEQAAQQDLRDDDQRHELDGLELGLREGADEVRAPCPAPRRPPRPAQQPDRALDVEAEQADATATASSAGRRRPGRTPRRSRAGSRACPSASPAAARGCRWSARAAWSRWSRGTSHEREDRQQRRPDTVERSRAVRRTSTTAGDQQARDHQQHRGGTRVAPQLGEHPTGHRQGDPRGQPPPPRRAGRPTRRRRCRRAPDRSGVSWARIAPSRISSSWSQRSASSMTWLETRAAARRRRVVEQLPQVAAQHRVETDGRLVEDQQSGVTEQRDREAGPGPRRR